MDSVQANQVILALQSIAESQAVQSATLTEIRDQLAELKVALRSR